MKTVAELVQWLEDFAPSRLAEPWDNVGLLWGDPAASVGRLMTCLTVTRITAAEAVAEQADLIVSHHPVLFREVKRIRADLPVTAPLWILARAGIAVASPHTAFDSTAGGINDGLCRRLGLVDVAPLRPLACACLVQDRRLHTRSPIARPCSPGPSKPAPGGSAPTRNARSPSPGRGPSLAPRRPIPRSAGKVGARPSKSSGWRSSARQRGWLPCSRRSGRRHSYEEPAIDVYPLHNPVSSSGSGRIGHFGEARSLQEFALFVSRALGHIPVQMVGDPRKPIRRVAVACGAGDDFLGDAMQAGADVLLTGEARFHRALEAESLDIGLVLAGHHATERPGVEELAERIARAFPDLTVWPSLQERDPLQFVHGGEQPHANAAGIGPEL